MERLRDLGQLVEEIKEKLMSFSSEEISLSEDFKTAFINYANEMNNEVEFNKTTAIITNSAGQKIYLPNHWFVLAAYPVELVKELICYRNYTEQFLADNADAICKTGVVQSSTDYRKNVYKLLSEGSNAEFDDFVKILLYDYLVKKADNVNTDIIEHNHDMLWRFVSDKEWWLGAKGIERSSDFYASPVLAVLNLVNVSQSYISTISYAYATNTELYNTLKNMRIEKCLICLESAVNEAREYSLQELAGFLKQMYGNAGDNLKVASIFMFGLKYAKQILGKNYALSEIIKTAGMNSSYSAELNKALNIYKCIDQNLYGICFADQKDIAEEDKSNINYMSGIEKKFSKNRILFGAPGTGKSHTLEEDRKELLYNNREADETKLDLSQYGSYERVTFHPDYSYAHFVGTYKPVPKGDEISYEYVAGPFIRTLVKALQSGRTENPEPYLLIIEEINRANAAAVFGDVFQLLDRKDGASEYAIQTSRELREYLAKPENLGGNPDDYEEIRIPDNMFIWATMNSADQGVYPMDTAFKRRWDFKYIDINEGQSVIEEENVGVKGQTVNWNKLRIAINDLLENDYGVNEDKLMGPFFITPAALRDDLFEDAFKNKVLMYLCEDVLRHRGGEKLFDIDMKHLSYAKVCNAFDKKGIDIFVSAVRNAEGVSASKENDKAGAAE